MTSGIQAQASRILSWESHTEAASCDNTCEELSPGKPSRDGAPGVFVGVTSAPSAWYLPESQMPTRKANGPASATSFVQTVQAQDRESSRNSDPTRQPPPTQYTDLSQESSRGPAALTVFGTAWNPAPVPLAGSVSGQARAPLAEGLLPPGPVLAAAAWLLLGCDQRSVCVLTGGLVPFAVQLAWCPSRHPWRGPLHTPNPDMDLRVTLGRTSGPAHR